MVENYRVLICTPFCNESHSIPLYMKSFVGLDYPKELIDVLWIENNSSDGTWNLLKAYHDEIIQKYKYHSFTLLRMTGDYKMIPKELFGLLRAGKRNVVNGMLWNDIIRHYFKILNYMLDQIDGDDFLLFWFADSVSQPDFLKRYIKVMEDHFDCGWVGGVMHRRYPRQRRCLCGNHSHHSDSFHCGVCSPYMSFPSYPSNQTSNAFEDYRRNPKLGCLVGFLQENDILEKQKSGNGVFCDNVITTAHIWLMRKAVIQKGLRFGFYEVDFALGAWMALQKMGYKIYCDSFVFIQHISVDGKIYRHSLSLEESDEERYMSGGKLAEILEQRKKEYREKSKKQGKQSPHP